MKFDCHEMDLFGQVFAQSLPLLTDISKLWHVADSYALVPTIII